ncbi:sulfurtransferase complex subunit TusB [Paraglaciecola aquimarina]|uniref:Sulfurtransferase complex subunit TusB n=1 Tax=Paraglaciecola algarum TaxID=3050085 RepID=A0ABS9D2E0_9ALTE|nr:sulfurtransferase complex subunit TusB [Paraglaciecola sp. G1-23]MCF2947046.1 sulfurtransferase complex subunit TusB [Paraglaciecola sp. G1-23]
MILHKFTASPYTSTLIEQTIERIAPQDKVILVQDAVYACTHRDLAKKLAKFKPVYCIQDDLVARGLTNVQQGFQVICYKEFVELTLTYKQVISW